MKQWLFRLAIIAALVLLALWLWRAIYPNTEAIIQRRLTKVARLASFGVNDSDFSRISNISSLMDYFTPDVDMAFSTPDLGDWTISGRDNLRGAVLAAQSRVNALRIQFLDANVTLAPDKQNATVDLTIRGSVPGDRDFAVHEMKFTFRNVDGEWLISRVETVKTLQ